MRDPIGYQVFPSKPAHERRHRREAVRVQHEAEEEAARRAKRRRLAEGEYSAAVELIVERDFFPDVPALRALAGVPASPLQMAATGDETGDGGGGERGGDGAGDGAGARAMAAAARSSLDRFAREHTTDEAESFREIVQQDQAAHRARFAWAFEGAGAHGTGGGADEGGAPRYRSQHLLLADGSRIGAERRRLMDAACEPAPRLGDTQEGRHGSVEAWPYRARNALCFAPELATSRAVCGSVDTPPGADVAAGAEVGGGAGGASLALGEGGKDGRGGAVAMQRAALKREAWARSARPPKAINHAATRLEGFLLAGACSGSGSGSGSGRPPVPARSEGFEETARARAAAAMAAVRRAQARQARADGAGDASGCALFRMTPSPLPMGTPMHAPMHASAHGDGAGMQHGTVGDASSSSAVRALAAGTPAGASAGASPLMTWGEIEGTPLVLDGRGAADAAADAARATQGGLAWGAQPGGTAAAESPFRIAEPGARERLAQRASGSCRGAGAGRERSQQQQGRGRRQRRAGGLTPAAQSLARRVGVGLGAAGAGTAGGDTPFDSVRASYGW
eukprot:g4619.t1